MRKMMVCFLVTCLCFGQGEDPRLDVLPEWAINAVVERGAAKKPDAAAWRLLDDWRIYFNDDGELMTLHRVVQIVLRQDGAREGGIFSIYGTEDAGEIERVKGWHIPQRGAPVRLGEGNILTMGGSSANFINRRTQTFAGFEGVGRGSLLVFESVTRSNTFMGPVVPIPVMGAFPTLHYRVTLNEVTEGKVELLPKGFAPWGIKAKRDGLKLFASSLPAIEDEPLTSSVLTEYPYVLVRYLVEDLDQQRYSSWDGYARWYWKLFSDAAFEDQSETAATKDKALLAQLQSPLREKITYRQVYLSNARGYVPQAGKEVMLRAYGDCKDMVACFAENARESGIRVYPVLANINDGPRITPDHEPAPMFNHLISAVPLSESLGLPAEAVVDGQRYLIYDPTARDTRFGYLPFSYAGRHVLICRPEGAVWVKINAQAEEHGSLNAKLTGRLEQQHLLKGTLVLQENGGIYGLRGSAQRDNARSFERVTRSILGLPPLVELSLKSKDITADGGATASFDIIWPAYLRQDADGYRLPEAIVNRFDFALRQRGRKRATPILFPAIPPITWDLDIALQQPLKPGEAEARVETRLWTTSWRAQGGSHLKANIAISFRESSVPMNQLEPALKSWRDFADKHRRLYQLATLLRKE